MRKVVCAVTALCLAAAVAGCGTTSRSAETKTGASSAGTPAARELPCGKLPPEANCPGPAPPKPIPISPDGPVRVFKSEYLPSGATDTENGIFEVAATDPGTFAETGAVYDARPGRSDPIEGARVTLSSVSGPGLVPPPGGEVRVMTKTGYAGAFAFIDMPVAPGGTCYRLVIVAGNVGRYESLDVSEPGVYDDGGLELNGGSEQEPYPYPTRGRRLPRLDRACAAQASR